MTAAPNDKGYEDEFTSKGSQGGWLSSFKSFDAEPCEGDRPVDQRLGVEFLLSQWGDGSRAFVLVEFEEGGGHVFCAENVNGVIRHVDPQDCNPDCSSYYDYTAAGETYCIRVDDLELTDTVLEAVRSRGDGS